MRGWLSEHHPSEVLGWEGPSKAPEVGNLEVYTADAEGKGDCDLFDLTGCPDFGHPASIRVGYDQLREVCSTDILSLPTSVVDLISLDVSSVPVLSYCSVVYALVGALEGTFETSNERISALG